ncbi:hypothetical protein QBC39DRAFT_107540 [Podospora conica]|nr:hypothetical protein QBC39DRAFT_107540 [Schizothecium conicum]
MGKTEQPPGRRRGPCTPYPSRYLPLPLSSHLCGTLPVPQNNMAFLFCIFSRYFSTTQRASHWPPLSPATPSPIIPSPIIPSPIIPSPINQPQNPRYAYASLPSKRWSPFNPALRRRLVQLDVSSSGWRRPALSSEGFYRDPLPCPVSVQGRSRFSPPPPPPSSLIRTPVVGRRPPMVCYLLHAMATTTHPFPIPLPTPFPAPASQPELWSLFSWVWELYIVEALSHPS